MNEVRKARISRHECIYCGISLPVDDKRQGCEECRNKLKSQYKLVSDLGVCGICKVNRATRGYKTCIDCREKARERMHGKVGNKERMETYRLRVLSDRKASGICTHCGRFRTSDGKSYCERCLDKIKNRRIELKWANA